MGATSEGPRILQDVAGVRPARRGVARLIAGYGAVACALPYMVLKVVWLSGGTLGVADLEMMREPSTVALNAVTAGMDLVAIAIALAFTHAWGLRIPAWLVLPPMWVASGLLARFVLALPLVTLAELLTSQTPHRAADGPVESWVYALVYTGFVGMGIGLTVAFVLYALARWAPVFRNRTRGGETPGATHAVQVPLAGTAALMALAVGVLHLAWALGATVGLKPEFTAARTIASYLINGVDATLALAAAAGILMLVHRRGGDTPLWWPLALAWVGAGSLFGWGLWQMINVLSNTALVRGRLEGMALLNLLGLVRLMAGMTIGLVILFLLAERRPPADQPATSGPARRLDTDEARSSP